MFLHRTNGVERHVLIERMYLASNQWNELPLRNRRADVQDGSALVLLRERQIEHWSGQLENVSTLDVSYDPNHFDSVSLEGQSPSQRVLIGPHDVRQGPIQDRHLRRVFIVERRKRPTRQQRNVQGVEIPWRDDVLKCLDTSGIALAPYRILPAPVIQRKCDGECSRVDARNRLEALDDLLLEDSATGVTVVVPCEIDSGGQHLPGLITGVDGCGIQQGSHAKAGRDE